MEKKRVLLSTLLFPRNVQSIQQQLDQVLFFGSVLHHSWKKTKKNVVATIRHNPVHQTGSLNGINRSTALTDWKRPMYSLDQENHAMQLLSLIYLIFATASLKCKKKQNARKLYVWQIPALLTGKGKSTTVTEHLHFETRLWILPCSYLESHPSQLPFKKKNFSKQKKHQVWEVAKIMSTKKNYPKVDTADYWQFQKLSLILHSKFVSKVVLLIQSQQQPHYSASKQVNKWKFSA